MSTFVLKHSPGMPGQEDYSYVFVANQERHLLHLERQQTTERIRNQTNKQLDAPDSHQSGHQTSSKSAAYELPVSYSGADAVEAAPLSLEVVLVDPTCRAFLFLGCCCPVFNTLQAWSTHARTWIHNVLWPRTYFRWRAFRSV